MRIDSVKWPAMIYPGTGLNVSFYYCLRKSLAWPKGKIQFLVTASKDKKVVENKIEVSNPQHLVGIKRQKDGVGWLYDGSCGEIDLIFVDNNFYRLVIKPARNIEEKFRDRFESLQDLKTDESFMSQLRRAFDKYASEVLILDC